MSNTLLVLIDHVVLFLKNDVVLEINPLLLRFKTLSLDNMAKHLNTDKHYDLVKAKVANDPACALFEPSFFNLPQGN